MDAQGSFDSFPAGNLTSEVMSAEQTMAFAPAGSVPALRQAASGAFHALPVKVVARAVSLLG